jgi:hypothetical protein
METRRPAFRSMPDRDTDEDRSSTGFDELTVVELGERLREFLTGVHDDRTVPRNRFLDRVR